MRDAADAALQFDGWVHGVDLDQHAMLSMALTRCLEILGEAASKVTPATRAQLTNIPFSKVISMRNRLIHAYFEVDLDVVWTTVIEDLPPLLATLEDSLEKE